MSYRALLVFLLLTATASMAQTTHESPCSGVCVLPWVAGSSENTGYECFDDYIHPNHINDCSNTRGGFWAVQFCQLDWDDGSWVVVDCGLNTGGSSHCRVEGKFPCGGSLHSYGLDCYSSGRDADGTQLVPEGRGNRSGATCSGSSGGASVSCGSNGNVVYGMWGNASHD